jgi:hypothetical protein
MVNKATGEAASAIKATVCCTGLGRQVERQRPTPMRQAQSPRAWGCAPCRAAPGPCGAGAAPLPHARQRDAQRCRDEQVDDHGDDDRTRGPRAQQRHSSGTPMKPVFGNAATSARNAALFQSDAVAERGGGPISATLFHSLRTSPHRRYQRHFKCLKSKRF